MFCGNCGNQLNENSKFCDKCGNPTEAGNASKTGLAKTQVDTEMQRAIYKLQNGDLAGAENIFESLAFTHNVPVAWVYIGGIKLGQLDSGKTKVEQALSCFLKASELAPESRAEYQQTYSDLSLQQVEKFKNYYLAAQEQVKKAKRGRFWNAALMGAAIGLGNQRSNRGNNTFRGTAGVAGAAYAFNQMGKHSTQKKEIETQLPVLQDTLKQLIQGVNSFCLDNQGVHQGFLDKINQLGLSNWLPAPTK